MAISAKQVSELRRKTGAGMMDCKKALVECDGDLTKAEEFLQKKSLAAVGKRSGRVAAEGLVGSYVHMGRIGVIVEINCETDFVARNEDFQALVKDVAMHIAAANPEYVRDTEIPTQVVAKQEEIFKAQLAESGKPEHIWGKIIEGKLRKWRSEICLVDQAFVKDPDRSVGQVVTDTAGTIKEKIEIRRFSRIELGAGIEKVETDFAAEVAAATAV